MKHGLNSTTLGLWQFQYCDLCHIIYLHHARKKYDTERTVSQMENAAAADEWKDDQREIRWHKSNFLGLQQMQK